jgi:signal peptidase I
LQTLTSLSCTTADFGKLSAEILQAGKSVRFRAHGSSMRPLLRDGDILFIQPVHPKAVHLGDIVLCSKQSGQTVAHRVIRKMENPDGLHFVVQGDQKLKPDGLIHQAQVYGRVAAVERDGIIFDMHRVQMKILGSILVFHSRWGFNRQRFSKTYHLIKRLPIFYRYLT